MPNSVKFHSFVDTTWLLTYIKRHGCCLFCKFVGALCRCFNLYFWLQLRVLPHPRHCAHRWIPCRTGIIFNIFSPKRTFDRDLISHIQQEIDLRPVRIKSWYKNKERAFLVKDHRYAYMCSLSVQYGGHSIVA